MRYLKKRKKPTSKINHPDREGIMKPQDQSKNK